MLAEPNPRVCGRLLHLCVSVCTYVRVYLVAQLCSCTLVCVCVCVCVFVYGWKREKEEC